MSDTTLNDIAGVKDIPIDELGVPIVDDLEMVEEKPGLMSNDFVRKIITAETGPGPITEYIEHAMNFKRSKPFAHVLRGLTGIFGSLNLAVIDIGVGLLQYMKERRA